MPKAVEFRAKLSLWAGIAFFHYGFGLWVWGLGVWDMFIEWSGFLADWSRVYKLGFWWVYVSMCRYEVWITSNTHTSYEFPSAQVKKGIVQMWIPENCRKTFWFGSMVQGFVHGLNGTSRETPSFYNPQQPPRTPSNLSDAQTLKPKF